ncbi:hypothetical protein LG299_12220 [Microbacterium lacus]|uniref:MauE/DoxX family redox-associated membrane protein n=1 Tax=Microbacterium lacus TaxID=415217 RepID=UPI0038517DFF
MFGPLLLLPAAIVAVVVIASGIAKLRHPDDLEGWRRLGVPAAVRRDWLVKLHPWAEIALGVALLVLGGVLGVLAGLAAVALMVAYVWLVARALRASPDAECACFGESTPVTRATVVRNVWLLLVALVALMGLWQAPLLGGVVLAADAEAWAWMLGAAVVAVTVALVLWRAPVASAGAVTVGDAAAVEAASDGEELDYIRVRTPAVPVTMANGTTVNLRDLAAQKPILLLAVSATCAACAPVIELAPQWRLELPELDVRLLVRMAPERGALVETTEPQSLHDPMNYVQGSIADWRTPSAVLLGADGFLAGGPATGLEAIEELVGDIRASLDELHMA